VQNWQLTRIILLIQRKHALQIEKNSPNSTGKHGRKNEGRLQERGDGAVA
jgi:hypothetical protein